MAIISSKDQIKRSVEAASRGRQTVIFTPSGQHVMVNIIKPENIQDIMPSLGINGVHPAFIVNGKTVSALLVGTYSGAVNNNEVTSQAMSTIGSGNYRAIAELINAMGGKWHMLNALEMSYFRMKALQKGYRPLGNTGDANDNMLGWDYSDHSQFGIRADGSQVGTSLTNNGNWQTTIVTGSGPASFRHDRTYNGVSDLVGNGFTYLPGIRFVGAKDTGYEVQVLGGENGSIANMIAGQLALDYDGNGDWLAIDATTGNYITPTFAGSLKNGDYTPTTSNAIKLYPSGKVTAATLGTTGYHLPLMDVSSGGNMGYGLAIRTGLNNAAMAKLQLIGAIPFSSVSAGNSPLSGTNESVSVYPTAGNCFQLLMPPQGMFGMKLTTTAYSDRPQVLRICSYLE